MRRLQTGTFPAQVPFASDASTPAPIRTTFHQALEPLSTL